MFARKRSIALSLVIVLECAVLCGCASPPQAVTEQPPQSQKGESPPPAQEAKEVAPLPPPTSEEVQRAVSRIFKDAVVIDASRDPSFLVGDLNGDQSQDLAVVLRPAQGKLSELNQEFPVWIAREPLHEVLLRKSKVVARASKSPDNPAAGQTVRFVQNDVLLAIIHGNGPKGWRDPEATQTHLMRGVVGANMRIMPYKEAAKVYGGRRPFPTIYGDLLHQTLIGQSGFLHFSGAIYAWYDPKNFEPEAGSPHSAMSKMR